MNEDAKPDDDEDRDDNQPRASNPEPLTSKLSSLGKTTQSLGDGGHDDSHVVDVNDPVFSQALTEDSVASLGSYHIYGVIGHGGFGTVFRAADSELWRPVAIKLLNRNLSGSSVARRRFIREARAAASISHVNVVAIYSVETADKLPFIVMELVEGRTLREKMKAEKKIDVTEAIRICHQIASGLAAAHAQGVIHRDIKPANILLKGSIENVKITDFGVARAAIDNVDLTSSGMAVGTPAYMAPEAIRGKTIDTRSDLFAVGCILYGMIAGHSPFHGNSSFEIAHNVLTRIPQPLSSLDPTVPPFVSELVEILLEKSPHKRVQSAQELSDILGHYLRQINSAPSDKLSLILKQSLPRQRFGARYQWLILIASVMAIGVGSFLTLDQFWKRTPSNTSQISASESTRPTDAPQPIAEQPTTQGASNTGALTTLPSLQRRRKVVVRQDGQADCASLNAALSLVEADGEIVVEDAAIYDEPLFLTSEVKGISIVATQKATLRSDETYVVSLNNCPKLSIRGFVLKARGDQVAIDVNGDCAGSEFLELTIDKSARGANPIACIWIKGFGTAASPIRCANVEINNTAIGIVIDGTQGSQRHAEIRDCTIRGIEDFSVLMNLNAAKDVVVSDTLLESGIVGFSIQTMQSTLDNVDLVRCTVARCSSFVNWSGTLDDCTVRIADNVLWRVRHMWSVDRATWFDNNIWQPTIDAVDRTSTWADTFDRIEMRSEHPEDADYLVPKSWKSLALKRPVGHAAARIGKDEFTDLRSDAD
ncbi:MAG: serine/threonine-protein kinase [Pirellulaceae bacterium]